MQLSLLPDDRRHRVLLVDTRLRRYFGTPEQHLLLDPVSQLVMAMIGGVTHEEVSLAAYGRLRKRFRRWEGLRDAPVAEIRDLIRAVNYPEKKAPRLKAALQFVTASEGTLSLDFLNEKPADAAIAWLEQIDGIGRKTSAAVLNFSTLRKPVLVIDTHHQRVAKRLGLVSRKADLAKAYDMLMPLLPSEWGADEMDDHHQLIMLHGQRLCRPSSPSCGTCPLRDMCRYCRQARRSRPGCISRPRSLARPAGFSNQT
ncbi:MAG: endonuclease III [Paracoccaceae bacterium]